MTEQALVGGIVALVVLAVLGAAAWRALRWSRTLGSDGQLLATLGVSALVAVLVVGVAALGSAAASGDDEQQADGAAAADEETHSDEAAVAADRAPRVDPRYYAPVFDPEQPPAGFPPLAVTSADGMQPGSVLFTTFTTPRPEEDTAYHPSFMTELDKQTGAIRTAQRVLTSTWIFRPEPDGRYSYTVVDRDGVNGAGFESTNYVVDGDLDVVASYDLGDLEGGDADPHDYRLLDNGNMLQLSYRVREADLSDVGGPADGLVYDTVVAERTPDGETVWLWDGAEHMDLADVAEPVAQEEYPRQPPAIADYSHPNSIDVFDDGDVLLSVRHYDCIYRIDRPSGDVVWTMGGPNCAQNDFEITGDPHDGFSHQHDATVLDDGNVLLFDNGNLRENPVSRVVEYAIDEEAMTAELVWSYDDGRYTPIMGSAERLDNGNTLIGWGALHERAITEVTGAGEEVFTTSVPEGQLLYRAYQGAGR